MAAAAKLGVTCAAMLVYAALASAQTKPTVISGCVVRDAANAGSATISANGISYRLTGKRDKEWEQYLGKRVEVTGTVEPAATASAKPPKDQTATAGQADVPATDAPRDNTTVPLATAKGTTADKTARLQVKTIRMVAPNCL